MMIGHLSRLCPRAQPPAELDTGQAGQHPVEDDQVDTLLLGGGDGAGAVKGLNHPVALVLEVPSNEHVQFTFVFHNQDGCHGLPPRPAARF